ncbi:hypothetical protein [Clavibacter michiganensis]|uniref:hypothetical protein n=1 Tax=Clavibacter michiganensis TaxID=28447 RepID=UPI0011B0EBD6|nr:hypothetical protein [Clavibacter michiganensis]
MAICIDTMRVTPFGGATAIRENEGEVRRRETSDRVTDAVTVYARMLHEIRSDMATGRVSAGRARPRRARETSGCALDAPSRPSIPTGVSTDGRTDRAEQDRARRQHRRGHQADDELHRDRQDAARSCGVEPGAVAAVG